MDIEKKQVIWREIKSWTFLILIALGIKTTVIASYIVPTGSMENTIMTGDFVIGNQFVYGFHSPDRIQIPFTKIGFDIPYFKTVGFKKPAQGDIMIFRYPEDHSVNYVKRCIGAPGQHLHISHKTVFVDGTTYPLPEHSKFIRPVVYPARWQSPEIFPAHNGNEDNYTEIYIPAEGDTLYFDETSPDIVRNAAELNGDTFEMQNGDILINGEKTDHYVCEQNYYFMMGDNRDNSLDSRFWGFVPEKMVHGKALFVLMSWNTDQVPLYRFWEKIRWRRFGKDLS